MYLNSIDLSPFVTGGAQPKLSQANLNRIPIPVPPPAEQERIVEILDKLDALVNDLSIGLPAELIARRKQYEHYRDRLLTFREAA
jgi:type I restriction enzyme S subunit